MNAAPKSWTLRLLSLLLASLFVLEPAALAAGPCASQLFFSSCCCTAPAESGPAVATAPQRSCCSAESTPTVPAPERSPAAEGPRCGCRLDLPQPIAPRPDAPGWNGAGADTLERWIARGALDSAGVLHPALLGFPPGGLAIPGARDDGPSPTSLVARATPGSAHTALCTDGARGLLAIYCTALL